MLPRVFGMWGRRFADFLLFGVTSVEVALLFFLTHTFTLTDWIYVLANLLVLGIAGLRDYSFLPHKAKLPPI